MAATHHAWGNPRTIPSYTKCPECGLEFVSDNLAVVYAQDDPAKTIDLMAGEASRDTCPFCGFSIDNAWPCLYIDPEHNACAYLIYSDITAEHTSRAFLEGDVDIEPLDEKSATMRIVRNRRELYTTALAFHMGLDDRAIEILKIDLLKVLMEEDGLLTDDDDPILGYTLMDVYDDALHFDIETATGIIETATSIDAYRLFERQLMRSSLANLQNFTVDLDWGFYAYQVLIREGLL